MAELERISVTIEKDLIDRFDRLLVRGERKNRSEAIRDLVRNRIVEDEWATGRGEAVMLVPRLDHLIGMKGVKHGKLVMSSAAI